MGRDDAVEVSIEIAARPETVFRYFSDPARFARWMGPGAAIEPRAKGAWRIPFPGGPTAEGRVVELDPPRRVVLTWGYDNGFLGMKSGSTTVEVTLVPTASGTRVTLAHRGLPPAARDPHAGGWRHHVSTLAFQASNDEAEARVGPLVEAWMGAWAEREPAARRTLLDRCFAEDGAFRDPWGHVDGRAALDAHIAASQAHASGASLVARGAPQHCHGHVRFAWRIDGPDGKPMATGTNFAELAPDGRIRRLVGFWDPAEPQG